MSLATVLTLSLLAAATSSEGASEGPAPAPIGAAIGPDGPVPATELWQDYVRVKRPEHQGKVLMIAAGVSFGVGAFTQLGDLALNDGHGVGFAERVFFGSAMVLAPIAGAVRGRYDAYMDRSYGRRARRTTLPIALGFTAAAIGAIGGLVNEIFWWQCAAGDSGPYYQPGPISEVPIGPQCRTSLARLALDSSVLLVGGGLGVGAWGLKYRRDARAYERAVLAVLPRIRSGEIGVGVAGRF